MKCSIGFSGLFVMSSLYPCDSTSLNLFFSVQFISYIINYTLIQIPKILLTEFLIYSIILMQNLDFGDFDCFRSQLYEKGRQQGIKQAESKSYEQNYATGLAYGRQWGKEAALMKATVELLKQKIAHSDHHLLKNPKINQLVDQLGKTLDQNYPPGTNVHKIEHGREEARKKYNILLAMLGLKVGDKKETKENMQF